jgi:microcystin degradation protein MlrC
MSRLRVGIAGFMHETNTFGPSKATFDDFDKGGGHLVLSRGADILKNAEGVNMGVAGALEEARRRDWEVVPILWAGAVPSAHVERDAFERIAGEIVDGLVAAGPLDGVYLDLHGAMVCEHFDDGEGELLRRVRAALGRDIPIAASLDLHANVTQAMVDHADLLVGYRTYPHVDMAETGGRTALLLDRIMRSGCKPAKAFRRIPFLISIVWQCTDLEPARSIYGRLATYETGGVASISFLPGFPAADFPECGPTVIAYADDAMQAERAAAEIADLVIAHETNFAGQVYSPEEGVREAMTIAVAAGKPVVLADSQDNPGAGGDSDTTGMLRALIACGASKAAIGVIVDPLAAAAAHAAGEGARLRLALGGRSGVAGDAPLEAEFVIERLSDGILTAAGPFYGSSRIDLGPSARLRIGGVQIVLGSRKAQLADQEMYRFVGIEPREQDILVVKSSVHFRADFAPIAAAVLVCAAPGPMPIDPAVLPWRRLTPGLRLSPGGTSFA